MRYPPGSFTKNFAWKGEGFLRLHESVRNGFANRLESLPSSEWSENSGVSKDQRLIALNFFLYQSKRGGTLRVEVDELVYQSICAAHSLSFDRLALFAFHLNLAGDGAEKTGYRGWATWANDFVREDLWAHQGGWDSKRLEDADLENALEVRIKAEPESLHKCFTNYRYYLEMAEYRDSQSAYINTGFEEWLPSALFLTWDRWLLESAPSAPASKDDIVKVVSEWEIHKLVGAPQETVIRQAKILSDAYLTLGGLDRFGEVETTAPISNGDSDTVAKARRKRHQRPGQESPPDQRQIEKLKSLVGDSSVERQIRNYYAQVRNRELAAGLKALYGGRCLFCELMLQVGIDPAAYYAEAAHIKPIGIPHNGPDKWDNMIPLCPNHHIQFDRGILRLSADSSGYKICSRILGDPLDGKQLKLHADHSLNAECVRYHFNWFKRSR